MSLKNIFHSLFFLFLFLLPFQTVYLVREPFLNGEKWQYGTIGIYATDIVLVALLVLGAFLYWRKDFSSHNTSLSRLEITVLIGFLSWIGLSALWAEDTVLAFSFFVKAVLGAGLWLLLRIRTRESLDLKKMVLILILSGLLQSAIGAGQFFDQEVSGSSFLGTGHQESFQAGSSVLKTDAGRVLRAYGTFPHPNVFGGFLGPIFVLSLWFLWERIRIEKSGSGGRFSRVWVTLSTLFPIGIGLGLILTFSRSAWLGAILAGAGIILYILRTSVASVALCYRKHAVVLILAIGVFAILLSDFVVSRFDASVIVRDQSVSDRGISIQDAWLLIREHPIFGVGAGNMTEAILREDSERPVWSVQPAHNVFVLVWSELGLIGLGLFLFFCIAPLIRIGKSVTKSLLEKIVSDENLAVSVVFLFAFMALIPSLFLDHFLWTSHFGVFFFFLIIGFLNQEKMHR